MEKPSGTMNRRNKVAQTSDAGMLGVSKPILSGIANPRPIRRSASRQIWKAALPPEKKKLKPILEVSRLRVERSRTIILDDVSWRVERGQHWVIIGANGSGKTSLLSALTGYLMPTSGEIRLLGQRYGESDWRELRKRVGLVSSSLRQMMAES